MTTLIKKLRNLPNIVCSKRYLFVFCATSSISQKNLIDVLLMDCPPELYAGPIDFDW